MELLRWEGNAGTLKHKNFLHTKSVRALAQLPMTVVELPFPEGFINPEDVAPGDRGEWKPW